MSSKKYIVVIALIFVLILGPVLMLTNFGLGLVQNAIDKNPKGSAAPWFQYTLGRTFYITLRSEKAAEAFQLYVERYAENKDQRYWNAMYYRAMALDDSYKTREAALLFQEYYFTCPKDDPNREEVKKECLRLRHHVPTFTPDPY
jgi:hypothetical protein